MIIGLEDQGGLPIRLDHFFLKSTLKRFFDLRFFKKKATLNQKRLLCLSFFLLQKNFHLYFEYTFTRDLICVWFLRQE